MSCSNSLYLKVCFGLICVVLLGAAALHKGRDTKRSSMRVLRILRGAEVLGRQENPETNPIPDHVNFTASKRKVPRGPDPIHNRSSMNSRRPRG